MYISIQSWIRFHSLIIQTPFNTAIKQAMYTEMEMSSFWWNYHHWQHWKLSKWQLPVQPVMKISSKWRHFRFSIIVATTAIYTNSAILFAYHKKIQSLRFLAPFASSFWNIDMFQYLVPNLQRVFTQQVDYFLCKFCNSCRVYWRLGEASAKHNVQWSPNICCTQGWILSICLCADEKLYCTYIVK